jgi:hypothetical protein
MDKTMRTNIAMSGEHPSLALVASLLAVKSQVPATSSADTLTKIQNLRGILDARTLSSARNGGDWRRGASSGSLNTMDSRWRGSGSGLDQRRGSMVRDDRLGGNPDQRRGSRQSLQMRTSSSTGSLTGANLTPLGGSSPTTPVVYTGPPMGRYQSRFKSSSDDIEEKILNRIIRLKLNKFGPSTYADIREFLFQILGQETVQTEEDGKITAEEGQVVEFVKDFMSMVFKKAASEQTYCALYAKLLSEIGSKHSVIFDEMNRLYNNYMEIFEEADVNVKAEDMVAYEKKVGEKKYRQGYSQFIAELTTLEILSMESLISTFQKLFFQIEKHARMEGQKPLVEEYVDCLLRMSRVMKDKYSAFFRTMRSKIYEQNKDILNLLIATKDGSLVSLSPKARFLLMDVQDILKV